VPVLRDDADEIIERNVPADGFPYAVRYNGADRFEGELIVFGSDQWPNWQTVTEALLAG
jgi:hypothetical protein